MQNYGLVKKMAMAETELEDERIYLDLERDLTREAQAIEEINAERNNSETSRRNPKQSTPNDDKTQLRAAQFDGYLLDAIDKALSSLGEPVKNTLYQHLEVDFGISKE